VQCLVRYDVGVGMANAADCVGCLGLYVFDDYDDDHYNDDDDDDLFLVPPLQFVSLVQSVVVAQIFFVADFF
jgi:hypothetical protein